jgi:hypothetical protein
MSTLSRKLPAERVTQGRRARLSLEELVAIAPAVGVDPEVVRLTILEDGDAETGNFAELAAWLDEEDRRAIPVEALRLGGEPSADVDWAADRRGPAGQRVGSQAELEALVPPAP